MRRPVLVQNQQTVASPRTSCDLKITSEESQSLISKGSAMLASSFSMVVSSFSIRAQRVACGWGLGTTAYTGACVMERRAIYLASGGHARCICGIFLAKSQSSVLSSSGVAGPVRRGRGQFYACLGQSLCLVQMGSTARAQLEKVYH